ncbi:MAG: hypothetical protein BGO59_31925 [Spirosoma sp. 48-14]|nr:MAG: hypothetical protein BGO59_31925 [Spirosoma sp. 48-14]
MHTRLAKVTFDIMAHDIFSPVYAFSLAFNNRSLLWAIDLSNADDFIWVATSIYKSKSSAGRSVTFQMKEWVKMYGRFQESKTSLSQHPPS